jgi:hypothetical protein
MSWPPVIRAILDLQQSFTYMNLENPPEVLYLKNLQDGMQLQRYLLSLPSFELLRWNISPQSVAGELVVEGRESFMQIVLCGLKIRWPAPIYFSQETNRAR